LFGNRFKFGRRIIAARPPGHSIAGLGGLDKAARGKV
jgi:hypothetical protein